jgi:hypothetical protein
MKGLQDIGSIAIAIAIGIVLVGIAATALMDLWLALLRALGVATQPMAFIGRWVGHLFRGQLTHVAIARAEPVAGERAWGWLAHYAIGIAFAGLLVGVAGSGWLARPTAGPALAVGIATVLAPLAVMQPAMGAGFFASKTPTPLKNCLRSLANHTVFGLGLYLGGAALALLPL